MSYRNGNPGLSPYDWDRTRGKFRANGIIEREKQRGNLPRLTGDTPCVDCSNPASDYDHRDYNKPLEVEPVCRSCNLKRGPAKPCDPLLPLGAPRVAWNRKAA